MNDNNIIPIENIKDKIFTIRGQQIVIDSDLAKMYQVDTKVLNQAVKRNIKRFTDEFRFQLSDDEKNELVTNCDRLNKLKHSSSNPYAFTEYGVAMLAGILKSDIAILLSKQIIKAFVEMRRFLSNNAAIFQRLENVEQKQILTDNKINQIFNALESEIPSKEQAIFFDNQFYDAYVFIADLIRTAKKEIILIDNYIDDTVLTLFTKRNKNVKLTIYTQKITEQLKLDIKKHNEQYPTVEVKKLKKSHDRFLIIDSKELYHIGASLKDLGKRWFAVSKFEFGVEDILDRL